MGDLYGQSGAGHNKQDIGKDIVSSFLSPLKLVFYPRDHGLLWCHLQDPNYFVRSF